MPIVQRFNDVKAPISMFAPIGNSPVMISKTALKKVVPLWHELAAGRSARPTDRHIHAACIHHRRLHFAPFSGLALTVRRLRVKNTLLFTSTQ